MDLTVVVPFRLASERFPDKALARFRGLTLLEHAIASAERLSARSVVLTGPEEDLRRVSQNVDLGRYRVTVMPSSLTCRSATDRVVEISADLPGEHVLSLPVDEPAIDPGEIRRALEEPGLFDGASVVTFYCPFFAPEDYLTPLSAKVVVDHAGMLIYMSRGIIPTRKDGGVDPAELKKNVGAFVFTRACLERLASQRAVPTRLHRIEGLEQLRWLELGLRIRCVPVRHLGFGVDVPEQLAALEGRMACTPQLESSG